MYCPHCGKEIIQDDTNCPVCGEDVGYLTSSYLPKKRDFFLYHIPKIVRIIAALLLLLALKRNPYSYYVLLRWAICVISVFSVWCAVKEEKAFWVWCFCIVALVFNPVFPIHLNRDIWRFVDIGTAVLFLTSIFFVRECILKNEKIPKPKENTK